MKTKIDPPAESEESRADQPQSPPHRRRPGCRLDTQDPATLPDQPASQPEKNSSFRSKLFPALQNFSRDELLEWMDKKLCRDLGVADPDVARRIRGQAILMREFGEPDGFGLGQTNVEAFNTLVEFGPDNIMESMLATQMSGVHEAALAFLKASGEPGLSQRQRDAEVRRAQQLLQLFNSQVEKMIRLKNQGWVRAEDRSAPTKI